MISISFHAQQAIPIGYGRWAYRGVLVCSYFPAQTARYHSRTLQGNSCGSAAWSASDVLVPMMEKTKDPGHTDLEVMEEDACIDK